MSATTTATTATALTATTAPTAPPAPTISEYDMFSLVLGDAKAPLIYSLFKIITSSFYFIWIALLVLIWIISGFAAFIASFVWLFYNSSIGDKIAGLVMALFAGPFYWLFYIYNMNYCNKYYY
jgi:hypothetical protein